MRTGRPEPLRELCLGLAALLAAVLSVAAIVWINLDRIQTTDLAAREIRDDLAQTTKVLESMLARRSALKHFIATGEPQLLESYQSNTQLFDEAIKGLKIQASDDSPALQARAADIAVQARRWTDLIAAPALSRIAAGDRAPDDLKRGKPQIDAIRADITVLRQADTRLLAERDAAQAGALLTSRLTLVLGSVLAIAFALAIGGRSSWKLMAGRRDAERLAEQLADALERAHAAERAKTLFLSNMSHEMRTPLNGVTGMAQALMASDLTSAHRELVETIQMSAAALDQMIGTLLTLSRGSEVAASPLDLTPFHLGEFLRTSTAVDRARAEAKGLALYIAVADEAETRVVGDASRLHQLLGCLLSNAVKFTEVGEIRLTVERVAEDRYRFEVADTGIGFDEARKSELFEAFRQSDESCTRRYGGAGLGLALARQLVADLGGQLDCRGTLGAGSAFLFEIALTAENIAPELPIPALAPKAMDDVARRAPLRVLVVDDNAGNRRVLQLILDQLRIEWAEAEDGQKAVAAVSGQKFSAILMDVQMPVMDGLTAVREIRRMETAAMRRATPVIIVSANSELDQVSACRDAGAQLHLTKPIMVGALVEALNQVLADTAEQAGAAA